MARRYGSKQQTKQAKRTAALQMVVMSDRSDEDKVRALVASYGFSEPEATFFVAEHSS
jgi:hypothetical protein